ncbi:MAG: class I adenylate-forming enzyme family protein [Planctomycetota bacterium]
MQPQAGQHRQLRELLHDRLRGRASPLVIGRGFAVPAATLWAGARAWVHAFRAAGLAPGDRVVLGIERSPAHIMVTIACWWEGLMLCPIAPATDAGQALVEFDARLAVANQLGACTPDAGGGPPAKLGVLREAAEPTPDIAMLLTTSGTSGHAKRVALSWMNLVAQLSSHTAMLGDERAERAMSVLPWHHAFGLLVDLWPRLLSGTTIYVDEGDGRDVASIAHQLAKHNITHVSMVPRQASLLLACQVSEHMHHKLGGVVGGAPVSAALAESLARTRLRAGYGLTEASPGVTLGEPGEWHAGWLGRPLGCEVRIVDGELHVRGPNVAAGYWRGRRGTPGRFIEADSDRWLATQDLVETIDGAAPKHGLRFIGRADTRFKLDNGRMIDTPAMEAALSAAFPELEPIVFTGGGRHLTIAMIGQGACATEASVAQILGSSARLVDAVVAVADDGRLRTAKGTIRRDAVRQQVTRSHAALAA